MRSSSISAGLVVLACVAAPAAAGDRAQFGQIVKKAQQLHDLQVTEAEEKQIGAAVSEKVRARYGVVQDAAVHKYVTLVGTTVAQMSGRPNLGYEFIVLDTDGVNAFAAPGGYVHITRGALALIANEAELAGVLGHEIIHVTEKHTIKAIQKGKMVQMGADDKLSGALFDKVVEKATDVVLAGFGRAEELEADARGIVLANAVGYAPSGISVFLTRLNDRNKSATEKQGLFASHPEMQERLDKIGQQITADKLTSAATLADRYRKFITFEPKAQTDIAMVAEGTAGLTGGGKSDAKDAEKDKAKEEEPKKKKGFGLGSLMKPSGGEKKSAEVTGSGASRGVDTERNAKGGSNPAPVLVTITAADLAAFKKEGGLK